MSLAATFKTDSKLERQGVSIELPAHDNGDIPVIVLARAGRNNPDYQKVVERIFRPFRKAQQLNALPQAKNDELTREAFAEAGILGWKFMLKSDITGNDGKDGRPLDEGYADYTKAHAIGLCTNLPDLYHSLIEMAVARETFQNAVAEGEAKNSVTSSSTGSSTEDSRKG